MGDAIAIRIKDITVTSLATASGNDQWMTGRFAKVCVGVTSEAQLDDIIARARAAGCGRHEPRRTLWAMRWNAWMCGGRWPIGES